MKILNCEVKNFGSYRHLSFSFEKTGLILLHGATGSGKSTFQDIPAWILTGRTAKGGNVDEVKNWNVQDEPTIGKASIEVKGKIIHITRIRGKQNENDLYWKEQDSDDEKHRGKDLSDTQKKLETRTGINSDIYTESAYFNEFSQTNSFFLASAKYKREVFERLANLELPITLAKKISVERKDVKLLLRDVEIGLANISGRLDHLSADKIQVSKYIDKWQNDHAKFIADLRTKSKGFEKEKDKKLEVLAAQSYDFKSNKNKKTEELIDKLDTLDQIIKTESSIADRIEIEKHRMRLLNSTCSKCNRPHISTPELDLLLVSQKFNNQMKDKFAEASNKLKEVTMLKNPYTATIAAIKQEINHYEKEIERDLNKENVFSAQLAGIQESIICATSDLNQKNLRLEGLIKELQNLDELYDLSFVLRGKLLNNTINRIQSDINGYLSGYFDSEFQVEFELDSADTLSVHITKNGHPCTYTQLSKGQRQLLKLCFSISALKATMDNSGEHLNLLCFDEPCDGLDEDLKIKAYSLFEELVKEHSSVLVIDHTPGFQSLFNNKCHFLLNGDESTIEYG